MPSRTKNTLIERGHRVWLKKVLNMQTNGQEGIDIFDEEYGIELKCKLLETKHQTGIPIADYQLRKFRFENPNRELLWAFLYYRLSKTLEEIGDKKSFNRYVTERDVYFQSWSFLDQFPPSIAKLDTWRYVRRRSVLSLEYAQIKVKKGTLHIPRDCSLIKRFKPELYIEDENLPF